MTDIGPWAALSYIPGVGDGSMTGIPDFVPDDDKVRLAAYRALGSFMESTRRLLMVDDPDRPGERDHHREFGDPAAYVGAIATAVLGEDPEIVVAGADLNLPSRPDLPAAPEEPEPGLPDLEAAAQAQMYALASAAWLARADKIISDWATALERSPRLEARQEWLRDWADPQHEDLLGKLIEIEHEFTVPLGDGILLLGWDHLRQRPGVSLIEPDAFFPVFDDSLSTFPDKVHLAWLFTAKDKKGEDADFVRRITYELVPIDPADPDFDASLDIGQRPKYLTESGMNTSGPAEVPEGDWTHACLYSEGVWKLDDFDNVFDVEANGVTWRQVPDPSGGTELVDADRIPTGLDFIPVIHFTHNPARSAGWGRSALTRSAQAFDQLARADTGHALSGAWAAEPLTVLKGLLPGQYEENADGTTGIPLYPGRGLAAQGDGGVSTVPMAENLEGLGRYVERMEDRLATVLAVPKGLMGRIEAADIASGITLVLLFTRFQQAIGQARMARQAKWPLVMKFVQRIEIQNSDIPFGTGDMEVYHATVHPGQFMPNDLASAASIVKQLRDSKAISQEGSLKFMLDAGLPLDDLSIEMARLREADGDTAESIAAAVGPRWAARYLGLRAWSEEDVRQPEGPQSAGTVDDPSGSGATDPESTSQTNT